MNEAHERFVVVTGGPGSGKSSLLDALQMHGYTRSVEAGRGVIQDQVAITGAALPWKNPVMFAELMLCWEMRSYHIARQNPGIVLFDRGIPDVLGYLLLMNLSIPEHVRRACETFRYNRKIFIAPPWREIYKQDVERKQDFDDAVRTYYAMVDTYTALNYHLIEIPRGAIEQRVQFVLERLASK